MIESMKLKQSLKVAELQDGDIVCFQRTSDKKTGLEKRSGERQEYVYWLVDTSICRFKLTRPIASTPWIALTMPASIMTSWNTGGMSSSTLTQLDATRASILHLS